jgi:hypothetical protein
VNLLLFSRRGAKTQRRAWEGSREIVGSWDGPNEEMAKWRNAEMPKWRDAEMADDGGRRSAIRIMLGC